MIDYPAPCAADEANRCRVLIVKGFYTGDKRVGDTFCPPPNVIPTLVQSGIVERVHAAGAVKADPPKLTRMLSAGGKRGGKYATR
jgi:hypothetical protein